MKTAITTQKTRQNVLRVTPFYVPISISQNMIPDMANATLKLAVQNLKFSYRLAVYCDAMSTAPPAAPIRNYEALMIFWSLENASMT